MSEAFDDELNRLRLSNFPKGNLASLNERLLIKLKQEGKAVGNMVARDKNMPITCIPYVHAFSHRMKKVGNRLGVKVAFPSRNKLGRVCAVVDKGKEVE